MAFARKFLFRGFVNYLQCLCYVQCQFLPKKETREIDEAKA